MLVLGCRCGEGCTYGCYFPKVLTTSCGFTSCAPYLVVRNAGVDYTSKQHHWLAILNVKNTRQKRDVDPTSKLGPSNHAQCDMTSHEEPYHSEGTLLPGTQRFTSWCFERPTKTSRDLRTWNCQQIPKFTSNEQPARSSWRFPFLGKLGLFSEAFRRC